MKQLPTFKGYTVDMRLSEFRRLVYGETPEFIPFDSPKGRRLWREFRKSEGCDSPLYDAVTQLIQCRSVTGNLKVRKAFLTTPSVPTGLSVLSNRIPLPVPQFNLITISFSLLSLRII